MRKATWKDSEHYDTNLSPQGWAWEFLRRNPDYQNDWKKYRAFCGIWSHSDEAYNRAPAAQGWECSPPARAGETIDNWLSRVNEPTATASTLRAAIVNRWGLLALPKDATEIGTAKSDLIFALPTLGVTHYRGWSKPVHKLTLGSDQVAIEFTLSHPLQPQVDRVRRFLKETQKWLQQAKGLRVKIDTPKYSSGKLVEYLRILDARVAGAKDDAIVSALYAHKNNTYPIFAGRKTLATAERVANRLRDGGYRELVQLKLKRRTTKD